MSASPTLEPCPRERQAQKFGDWAESQPSIHKTTLESTMEQAQLIQAAASIAGGMAAAHYDKFAGLVASRITEIAETAVKIAKAIEIEARKQG
jgi:hypothetical protein